MSEYAPKQEKQQNLEAKLKTPEQHKLLAEHLERSAKQAKEEHAQALQEARTTLKKMEQSFDGSNLTERFQEQRAAAPAQVINRELKSITLNRELRHLQRKLPVADRALSKVVHQPAVRAVSEAAAKTVSRPSGLLGGGILAFLGTSGYLYLANHMGFTYNYGVFFLLLVTGFALGLLLELVIHPFLKSRSRSN